jgi:hypothetical protein
MRSILTFDLHVDDRPRDIEACARQLTASGWQATFFVPTGMLERDELRRPIEALAAEGFELGTHGHHHTDEETDALRNGDRGALDFLKRSAGTFAEVLGKKPRVFRSPCWAHVGETALDELALLGYHVDSSSTPQRPGILSAFPYDNRHLFAARAPHFVRPGLLEIPTSSFLVPLGWPTFCTLRRAGSLLVANLMAMEATLRRSLVVVGQFHASDLAPCGGEVPCVEKRWSDLIPRATGGIGARRWLRVTDSGRVAAVSTAVMARMARGELTTMSAVREEMLSGE